MTTRLVIDYRERELIPHLPCALVENLQIGDIHYTYTDESGVTSRIVFERKTYADLLASIKDGRYREQKLRMMTDESVKAICYVLEGEEIEDPMIIGSVLNTLFRDHLAVYKTRSVKHTAEWILEFWVRFQKDPLTYVVAKGKEKEWIDVAKVKTCKKDNIDTLTCFHLQLCQLPGFSSKIAKNIADASGCETMSGFIDWLKNDIKKLDPIPLLGPKKKEVLLRYLGI